MPIILHFSELRKKQKDMETVAFLQKNDVQISLI